MSAAPFYSYAAGPTAQEAFAAAVAKAAEEYGTRGYTGSLAEKREHVMIPDTLEQVKARLLDAPPERHSFALERVVRAELLQSPRLKAQAIAFALISLDDGRIFDRFGPAGCIAVEEGRWLFFGWAPN